MQMLEDDCNPQVDSNISLAYFRIISSSLIFPHRIIDGQEIL